MKLLESKRVQLPKIFFVTELSKIKLIPKGVPFIYGDKDDEEYLVRVLEYEVLYQSAVKSGYPFDFKQILKENGYDVIEFGFNSSIYREYAKSGLDFEKGICLDDLEEIKNPYNYLKDYVKDCSAYVDIEVLKSLNVFPVWLADIEKAINTNIHNFAVFNNNMYNKKLEGMYGGLELTSPKRNLLIVDISSSIPRAVSSTLLVLAKNLSENFYADILITGSKSTLYIYEEIYKLNIKTIYDENGMGNDQSHFRKLVTEEVKDYQTAIVFGDDDSPCYAWNNMYNAGTEIISREDGKKLCKWKIGTLMSFHKSTNERNAGYADWFTPEETQYVSNWVKYLNK